MIALVAVLLLGYGLSAAPFLAARRRPIWITVVKYTPADTLNLKIVTEPDAEMSDFVNSQLSKIGLHGEICVNRTFRLGPDAASRANMLIILTHPVRLDVKLPEPKADVVYLQDGEGWKKLPEDATTTFRKVEIYPISGNCVAVTVWNTVVQQSGVGGPCW